jgi:hypothetical protein
VHGTPGPRVGSSRSRTGLAAPAAGSSPSLPGQCASVVTSDPDPHHTKGRIRIRTYQDDKLDPDPHQIER